MVLERGFVRRADAAAALRAEIREVEMGEWVEPSKVRLDAYLAEWVEGLRLKASTLSSYRRNIRLHIDPYLGATPLSRLTGTAVDAWMRALETSGRADGRGGLSARHPERFSRRFSKQVAQARRALGRTSCCGSACTTCATPTPRSCWPRASR